MQVCDNPSSGSKESRGKSLIYFKTRKRKTSLNQEVMPRITYDYNNKAKRQLIWKTIQFSVCWG